MTKPAPNLDDNAVRFERALLCSLLEDWSLWPPDTELRPDDFLLRDHRIIFGAMCQLHNDGVLVDIVTLAAALEGRVESSYLGVLLDHGPVTANFKHYVRQVREAARERRFRTLSQLLASDGPEQRSARLEELRKLVREPGSQDWRKLFHSWEEFENAPPLTFAVNGFLQEDGVTLIGGLAGQGKTLLMLSMVRALLTKLPLFGYEPFSVPCPAPRVIYLIPESSIGPFWSRIKLFHLEEFVREDRLLIRTLSAREQVELTDPRMFTAVESADVFLDSVIRFTVGGENDAENIRLFSSVLFHLLQAGARSIVGCHHSPKSFETAQTMSLENILRGSGDLGAMISTCWGIRQIDAARNRIYVECVKSRDFEPCPPFILEGRPHLDTTGEFAMHAKPGEAEELRSYLQQKGGRPLAPDRAEQIAMAASLRAKGESVRQIAESMKLSKSTVSRMLYDYDLTDHDPEEGVRKPQ
jgi:DnaB-like helicase N terminal domain/AAA domain